jgi:hypothetical protein
MTFNRSKMEPEEDTYGPEQTAQQPHSNSLPSHIRNRVAIRMDLSQKNSQQAISITGKGKSKKSKTKETKSKTKKTHSLIHTPPRRPIQIRPQINPQPLPLTNIPSSHILPLHPLRAPSKSISLIRKRPERILRRRERNRQDSGGSAGRLAYTGVQFGAFGVDEFDKLAVDDLELARGCGVGEDCSAW